MLFALKKEYSIEGVYQGDKRTKMYLLIQFS